jgi:hypothetical protein
MRMHLSVLEIMQDFAYLFADDRAARFARGEYDMPFFA